MSASGQPVAGPVDLKLEFFDAAAGGTQVGPEVDDQAVALINGVFQAPIALDGPTFQAVFGSGAPVFVQVTDVTHAQTYPRQTFSAVPYALRVPVDGSSIGFNTSGELTLTAPQGNQLGGQPVVGNPSMPGQVLQYNGTEWVPTATLNLNGGTVTGLATPINPNDAVTKTYADNINTTLTGSVTALSGAALKKDGSVPLTATWNEGAQDITNTGNLVMAGSKAFGLSVATTDPSGLNSTTDVGKIWYNGGIKLWNGNSAQTLGISGAGLTSLAGDGSNTQNLLIGSTGTAPAWVNTVGNHTLDIPMANTASVTAGLISNGDWTTFNGKQNVLPQTTASASGYLASADWSTFNAKQNALSGASATTPLAFAANTFSIVQGTASTNGYLASADWATFNGKQPNLGYTPVNKVGDSMSGTLTMTGGAGITGLPTPVNPADAATKSYADGINTTLSGELLQKNGSVALTGSWGAGGQDITDVGNITMTGSKTLLLGAYGTDPVSLGATDAGKLWFNSTGGKLHYWDGAAYQTLGTVTGAVSSVAGRTGAVVLGTTDVTESAADLYFTTARAQASVTATAPIQYNGSTGTFSLAPATIAANGYLASVDWATFNARQAALGYAPVSRAGDTMSGALNLPANGLSVGTNQLILTGGNVGIGSSAPGTKLEVAGTIHSTTGGIEYPDGTTQTTTGVNVTSASYNGTFTCNATVFPTVTCPAGYYVSGCSAWTGNFANAAGAWISGNGCQGGCGQGGTNSFDLQAICIQVH